MTLADAPAFLTPRTSPLTEERIAYLLAALLVGLGGAMTAIFGLPGLAMTALALVPVMTVLLILLSVGK